MKYLSEDCSVFFGVLLLCDGSEWTPASDGVVSRQPAARCIALGQH